MLLSARWRRPAAIFSGPIWPGLFLAGLIGILPAGAWEEGVIKRTWTLGEVIFSSPAIASNGTVWTGCNDGKLCASSPMARSPRCSPPGEISRISKAGRTASLDGTGLSGALGLSPVSHQSSSAAAAAREVSKTASRPAKVNSSPSS